MDSTGHVWIFKSVELSLLIVSNQRCLENQIAVNVLVNNIVTKIFWFLSVTDQKFTINLNEGLKKINTLFLSMSILT